MDWMIEHWVEVIVVINALITVISYIVKWTPNTKDDTVWAKILSFLKFFSLGKTE